MKLKTALALAFGVAALGAQAATELVIATVNNGHMIEMQKLSKHFEQANPDIKIVIEYKPREPRVKMAYDSVSRTLLALEKIDAPNVGILLDFGHALFGGESPADSAQLAIDYGRLFGMDVNDNFRGWDDDLIAGTVHPIELFEFFYVLRKNNWEGVWQLDQFPFRDDHVEAAKMAIEFLKRIDRGLDKLDFSAMAEAQSRHDAITAGRLAREALFG
mgnify:CR=1 FL=1